MSDARAALLAFPVGDTVMKDPYRDEEAAMLKRHLLVLYPEHDPVHVLDKLRCDIDWDSESDEYLFERGQFVRFMQRKCFATSEDFLRSRVPTRKPDDFVYYSDEYHITFTDVGGQRPYRSHWQPVLAESEFDAVVWVLALDDYTKVLSEDTERNRLSEALLLWRSYTTTALRDKPVVLLLNKVDALEKKIVEFPVESRYKLYLGKSGDADAAADYFEQQCIDLSGRYTHHGKRLPNVPPLFVLRTCCTDSMQMKHTLQDFMRILLELPDRRVEEGRDLLMSWGGHAYYPSVSSSHVLRSPRDTSEVEHTS
jgi:hypothetical protein